MNRIARYILISAGIILMVSSTGCDKVGNILNPDPATIEYDGAVFNTTDQNLRVYIADPDPEYGPGSDNDYTKPQRLDALNGVASYWLRERTYTIVVVHAVTGAIIGRYKVQPNGVHNDVTIGRDYVDLDWSLVNGHFTS